jgi:hypothetical protein
MWDVEPSGCWKAAGLKRDQSCDGWVDVVVPVVASGEDWLYGNPILVGTFPPPFFVMDIRACRFTSIQSFIVKHCLTLDSLRNNILFAAAVGFFIS